MKLDDYMRYPHPVLSELSGDYTTGEFVCGFEQNLTPEGELRLVADLRIDSDELVDLIQTQAAAPGYFVVCRRTYFNHLQAASLGRSEKFFDASKLFGAVTIRPVVYTLSKVEGYTSPLINVEFGAASTIGKGAIIALGPEFRFSMDQKKYKPFDSIFELARNEEVPLNTFRVDHDQDRITILAREETYNSISSIRDMNQGKDVVMNTVYLPAVVEVISRLQTGGMSVEGRKWYRIFKAKCDDLGANPVDPDVSPLDLAQQLLRRPFVKTIALMESF
ncbi:MAG: hypothetical protein KJ904_00095 [Alphaproteobacteria bacterium]|nr:hypothetical protein [Alphaproteobacteria bacterium]MBU0799268.1 hypothetical protein [Alphaproteobacteria bacterium]MBU0885543.1 hypothetical protein [Alphaproteobacteria bacterium]MBU1812980.1 hypothetical protein [Alphaproteobacteria bacterium]